MEVILGTIVTTFGIKGEVKVHSNTDFAKTRYKVGNEVILYSPITQKKETLKISSHKQSKGMDIISFENLTNPDMVLKYIGYKILADKKDESLGKDVYHYAYIYNCNAIYEGNVIGKVVDIINSSSHLTLRIKREDKKDILYPFIERFITSIDIEKKEIVLNPIKGMLDL